MIHNEVLRFGKTLTGQAFEQPDTPAWSQTAKKENETEQDKKARKNPETADGRSFGTTGGGNSGEGQTAKKEKRQMTTGKNLYVSKEVRFKTLYVSKMLVRSCAMTIAQMTRENSMYNGHGDGKNDPESGLAERDPKQQWHNYISYN